ncbi:MAG TPA: tetratricopeptide repeat protein [Acidobacteriota bacterium]|nr:tetratricopeptide repeat protein [Acidobacteriota bacterium]
MKRTLFLAGGLVAVLALAGIGFGQTAAEHLLKGDEYFAAFDDQKALDEYLAAVQLEPGNYEALWKAARGFVDVSDLITGTDKESKDKRKKMYNDAGSYANKAVGANRDDTWGHFMLSSALGNKALLMSTKDQIDASKKIRAEIDKAIELDGTNDLACHALGRWHRRMAEIGGAKRFFGGLIYGSIPKGTFADAEKAFQKAIELKPDYVNHHIELARTYMAMGKFDLAVPEYQKTIDLPITASKDKDLKAEAAIEIEKAKRKQKLD